MNCQLTIDLNSVSYVKYFYQNGRGDCRRIKPNYPTVNGYPFETKAVMRIDFDNPETALAVATRRKLLDIWTPVCIYQFRNNHSMRFVGEKAKQMKAAYNKHIYGK